MCGVAGAIRWIPSARLAGSRPHDPFVNTTVERMSHAIRHRGPDGVGSWESGCQEVTFAHRRLAIIDLSEAGAQPMIDPDTGCAITYNGEIYNFLEIRRDLERLGETFRSVCDTEVILKAYKHWGIDSVSRFRGIFAFALWCPRSRAVHLVRDQMGIKPLYWTRARLPETGEEVVLFASELRALLASGLVERRLDPAAVASYLWHGFTIGPGTIVEGVELLPAATVLTISADDDAGRRNSHVARRYWQLPRSTDRVTTPEEMADELARTVRMQLVSDVPLGVFLSGGIDSSAVAALASLAIPDGLHTFTVGFDVPEYDETRHAQRVADAIRSRHTTTLLTGQGFRDQLPEAMRSIDQPTIDGINTYFVSAAARNAGMTVALAGTGGDELFGGYRSYEDVPTALRYGRWLPFAGGRGAGKRAFDGLVELGTRGVSRLYWGLLDAAPPQTRWAKIADVVRAIRDPLGLYQVSYALFTQESQAVLAAGPVRDAQRGQVFGLPAPVAGRWRERIEGSELLHAISVLELLSFVGERLLRDTDAASMAVALEVRVPLLDHALAESVAGLAPGPRFEPVRKKRILREAALQRLDPAIFDRPKSGFVLPIDVWAREALKPQMDALFADAALARRVGLRPEAVATLWRSFQEGRRGMYWSRIWAIFVLLSWCQAHDVQLAA